MIETWLAAAMLALPGAPDGRYPVVVTRDDGSLPGGCRPREVASLAGRFLGAVNRGDTRAATRIMDPLAGPRNVRPRGWYSITEAGSRHFVAYRRAALERYFARRHRHGERMRLLSVSVGAGGRGRVGIEYRIRRSADDVATKALAFGKGAIDCRRQRIFVWSMSHSRRGPGGPDPCGKPARRRVTLACSRR